MAINKVVYDGSTLIDLSSDTLSSANQLAQGIVAHDRTGAVITGTNVPDNALIITLTDNPDWDGESDDFLLKDKTFAEIRAAYFAGKTIAVNYKNEYGYFDQCWYSFDASHPTSDYFEVVVRDYSNLPHGPGNYFFMSSDDVEWRYDGFEPWEWTYWMGVFWDTTSNKWVLDEVDYNTIKSQVEATAFPSVDCLGIYDDDLSAIADCYWDYDNDVLVYTVRQNDNGIIKEYSYTFGEGDVTTLTDYHEYSTPPSAGTEGTPVATKGTVSNHSISVTPSVTNVGGVIQGGTHTGTAVTVSASELVSGTYTVDSAGQTDVTNYATATVPTASYYTGITGQEFYTENGQRKWHTRGLTELYTSEGDVEGWIGEGQQYSDYYEVNAVPANTTITPSTSAQTVGGADYMMEGAVTVSAMPTGTAGTPSASKGTVSNNSVTVTPSVTNTTGYITGGTKTGTGVSVSASELVSGTYTISSSGSHNVTNYASASVASGSATASATKGTVSNHSVSVTPSVTRTAGYITAGSSSGTAVTVSASELVSGSQTITQNGTVDVTNLASVVVDVQGGGSGVQMGVAGVELSSASSSISFTGLHGEPTSFVICPEDGMQTSSPASVVMVVFDGTTIHGQTASTASNANASYDTGFTKSYSNGTLTVTATTARFGSNYWMLDYSYGGSSANIGTKDVQVGSGATSITFTGLDDEPIYWSCIFKSNFSTSSGYQRVMANRYNGSNVFGAAMDSSVHMNSTYWTQSYSNGSLTITSQGTNAGGYFHQPGYYQLTAVYGEIEPQEIDVVPLSVTTNGTYTAPSGTAYSPVTVNVSGGGATVATTTWSNTDSTATTHTFTGLSGTPKAAFLRCTTSLSRSSSSSNYYVADMRWTGTATAGNSFRRSNGTYANVTSGYSFSASGTSLTVTTTGTSTSNPGSFYNGTYELTYIY